MKKLIILFILSGLLVTTQFCTVKQELPKGAWTKIETENTPVARHENGFIEVDGKFYLLGGRGIKPTNIFDPQTQSWSDGAKPPIELHHFQSLVYNGKIYVIGAMTGPYPHETAVENFFIYDPVTDAWEKGPEIPQERRRGSSGAVLHHGKFYMVGGIIDGHYDGHVVWFDEYDPLTNSWKQLADAPRVRDHFHAVIAENKLYAIGGRITSLKTKQTFELTIPQVDIYDFVTETWTSAADTLPTLRAGTSTVVLGDDVLVIGGESGTQQAAHSEVEAFNIHTQTWRSLTPLMRGRHGTQAFLFDNKIYTASGSGNRGGGPELTSIEFFSY